MPIERPDKAPVLHFLGAAGTVTGSRFLVEGSRSRVLVDCGLFQGLKELRLRNWNRFPVDERSIDAVVLTHAHVDHSGYIPAISRNGFRGPIYASHNTAALCRIVLPDSGRLQEEDADYANRRGFSKHSPARPLYTEEDAVRVLARFRGCDFNSGVDVAPGMRATFSPAGHILGACSVLLECDGRRLLFSGDLGRSNHPILRAPAPPPAADLILVESTYGDRRHGDENVEEAFGAVIARTTARGGCTVIPSFAVDRTEMILHALRNLRYSGKIPAVRVYVDSPLALGALAVYRNAIAARSSEIRPEILDDPDPFDTTNLFESRSVEDSKKISAMNGPAVIISASGMATGGRVLHHLAQRLPDPRNTVALVGYQAEGTRGRALADGSKTLKMLGRYVPVRAEIANLPAFSAHADQGELLAWLRAAPRAPETLFTVHGEALAATALKNAISSQLGWCAAVPRAMEIVRID